MISCDRVGAAVNGKVDAVLDTYVRLAGALHPLGDLLAGVTWTPGSIELEFDAGCTVEFQSRRPKQLLGGRLRDLGFIATPPQ